MSNGDGTWRPEDRFWWIHPEKIRDGQKRRPDDEDFNPSTLFIPRQEYEKMGGYVSSQALLVCITLA